MFLNAKVRIEASNWNEDPTSLLLPLDYVVDIMSINLFLENQISNFVARLSYRCGECVIDICYKQSDGKIIRINEKPFISYPGQCISSIRNVFGDKTSISSDSIDEEFISWPEIHLQTEILFSLFGEKNFLAAPRTARRS